MEDIYNSYKKLLNSGMFWELYPELSGEWDKDKDYWYEEYFIQLEILKNK